MKKLKKYKTIYTSNLQQKQKIIRDLARIISQQLSESTPVLSSSSRRRYARLSLLVAFTTVQNSVAVAVHPGLEGSLTLGAAVESGPVNVALSALLRRVRRIEVDVSLGRSTVLVVGTPVAVVLDEANVAVLDLSSIGWQLVGSDLAGVAKGGIDQGTSPSVLSGLVHVDSVVGVVGGWDLNGAGDTASLAISTALAILVVVGLSLIFEGGEDSVKNALAAVRVIARLETAVTSTSIGEGVLHGEVIASSVGSLMEIEAEGDISETILGGARDRPGNVGVSGSHSRQETQESSSLHLCDGVENDRGNR